MMNWPGPTILPFSAAFCMGPTLAELCRDGKLEEVRAALARGEEVNQFVLGFTGLTWAAVAGHEAVVELLLKHPGLDVNLAAGGGLMTALQSACMYGHTGILRRLLAHPSLTCHNAVDICGSSALSLAVKSYSVECVRQLVAVKEVDLEARDMFGRNLEEVASEEIWQVLREGKRRREEQVRKEVQERREEAKNKLQKDNVNDTRREERNRTLSMGGKGEEGRRGEDIDRNKTLREEVECPVCCEEMAPPRTIFQCSQGHPVCSSCKPKLVDCPSCREAFIGRARGMEQLVLAILDKEAPRV